jgi:uncharacterized protein YkwD
MTVYVKKIIISLLLVLLCFLVLFSTSTLFVKANELSFQETVIQPSEIVTETNKLRLTDNKKELTVSELLNKSAQMKADDMAARSYFSHNGPLGERPWSWLNRNSYKYSYAGENLAVGFSSSSEVIKAWGESKIHKANLLNKNYTEIGVGVARGMYDGKETTFIVQFFAKPI